MGFEKTVSFFKDNWSKEIEELFSNSLEYCTTSLYPALLELFCEKKYKDGIVYIIHHKENITQSEIEFLSNLLDEYTIKDIILTLLSKGTADYSKILHILENIKGAWAVEFLFYVLDKMNIKSLGVVDIDIFSDNLAKLLESSPLNIRYNIIKELEKNIERWRNIPSIWNKCLKYETMYETFIKCFFKEPVLKQDDVLLLNLIEPSHYINILNFLIKNHYIDKNLRNNFYQFLFATESVGFFNAFLEYICNLPTPQLVLYADNFYIIPFFTLAVKLDRFNGTYLLFYLYFIYLTRLNIEEKLEAIKNILNSSKTIDTGALKISDISANFLDDLIKLDIKSETGLGFVFDIVDKKGDGHFIQKLQNKYDKVSPSLQEKINKILIKHSLKSLILDEKKEVNLNAFIEVLKKIPFEITNDIISLIYNSNPAIKMRLIKLIELLNYEKGIENIIETLMYKEKDKKVRATCTRLLKFLKEEEALKHIRVLMFDNDSRVRANAVEIFEYFANSDNWFVLLALANDENNRVRGNVAKAIYPFSKKHSIEIIKDMLKSNKELFVLTALWVIEKLNIAHEFQDILPLIEQKHTSPKVKQRLNRLGVLIRK